MKQAWISPIGSSVAAASARRFRSSAAYRREAERLAPFEAVARAVIRFRGRTGLSQAALACRAGLNPKTVRRVEAGYSPSRLRTLERLAAVIDDLPIAGAACEGTGRQSGAPTVPARRF